MRNRDRLTCTHIGTTKELGWSAPPAWHHVRKTHELLAELARGDGRAEGWLARDKGTGLFVEILPQRNGYSQRAVLQHKAEAALAASMDY